MIFIVCKYELILLFWLLLRGFIVSVSVLYCEGESLILDCGIWMLLFVCNLGIGVRLLIL